MEKIKGKKGIVVLLLIFYICIFLIGKSTMLSPDEYNYSHITWTDQKILGVKDIIKSQALLYEKWTGRIPVHTLIQTILYIGTWIYYIINPIIFITFVILIGKIVSNKTNYFKISLTLFLILFFVKSSAQKFIWLSGSINYLWTSTIMLGVMYYFYNILMKDNKITNKEIPMFFAISFFAGWSQENVAFVLGTFIIMICLINIKKFLKYEKRDKIIIIASIILFGIGAMALIFAPGNFIRANTMQRDIKSSLLNIINNVKEMKEIIIIYIISALSILMIKSGKKEKKTMIKTQLILVSTVIIAVLPMLFITEFPTRAALAYETVILVGILANTSFIIRNLNLKKTIVILEIICTIGICYKLAKNVSVSENYVRPYKEKMIMEIYQEQKAGKKDAVLSEFKDKDKIVALGPTALLRPDDFPEKSKDSLTNRYMARYYGFDNITTVEE